MILYLHFQAHNPTDQISFDAYGIPNLSNLSPLVNIYYIFTCIYYGDAHAVRFSPPNYYP